MFGHSSSVLKRCTLAESLFLLAENSQNVGITSISISWKISKIHPISDKKKAPKSTDSIAWVTNFNWGHYFWGLIWGQF